MNNVERDWVGSIEHTSYRLGGCYNTEEDQMGLKTPLFPSPPWVYNYSTGQSQGYHITQQPDICYSLHTIPVLQHYI